LRPLDGHFEFNVTTIDDTPYVPFDPITTRFDKLLFLNDVVFSARDAADLLFATNADDDGVTNYRAACAMDFINAFKFYDTFASRDAEGYRAGIPFFPWFANAGRAISRTAVLSQTDAVPVRGCWGGMVAFEAKWFQPQVSPSPDDFTQSARPLRFRADDELFWDSSECCLVHADLDMMASKDAPQGEYEDSIDRGIYINPYIRVAYESHAFSWLEFTRRFERLYTFPHQIANVFAGRPVHQERRDEVPGDRVAHQEWVFNDPATDSRIDPYEEATLDNIEQFGHWTSVHRIAKPGGFCGYRFMLTLRDHWVEGEKHWEKLEPPPGWKRE
jgi:Cryptococcal mannosyltransferase 1